MVHQAFDRELAALDEPSTSDDGRAPRCARRECRATAAARAAARTPRRSSPASSTRMTPRLPDSASGLTTQGNVDACERARGSSVDRGCERTHGTGRPAARKRSRVSRLFRAAAAASGGCPGRPSASADTRPQSPSADRQPRARRRSAVRRAASRIASTDAIFVVRTGSAPR